MDDIKRLDRKLFMKEVLRPGRLILTLLVEVAVVAIAAGPGMPMPIFLGAFAVAPIVHLLSSHNEALRRRFINKRFEALWNGCKDRLSRFEEVLTKMRKEQVADLQEMPRTIRRVGDALYAALRRADVICHEVQLTEQGLYSAPPVWSAPSSDAQAKELYRIADKNIAEYRQHYAGVMAGVQRAEAQSAVYMTTLDSLRMKMIGYRLVGKSPELSSQDFLEALSEAKLQLQAIDKALDELDFTQMPQMIAVMPPPPPADAVEHLRQQS